MPVTSGWNLRNTAFEYTRLIQHTALGNIDHYQIALMSFLLVAFVISAFLEMTREQKQGGWVRAPWFYCVLLILSLLILRTPTFLALSLNPDEGQFIAGAMKLRVDPVFWRSVDGGSSGAFNYYPLVLLNLIGLPLDYATARLMNVLSVGGAIAILYLVARLLMPEWCARLAPLPALAAAMNFREPNFLHYSSECFPALLTAIATLLLHSDEMAERRSRWRLFALGLIITVIPFTKLQASPGAALIGLGALGGLFIRNHPEKWRLSAYMCAGGLSILASIAMVLAVCGALRSFWTSYVEGNIIYVNTIGPRSLDWFYQFVTSMPDTTWYADGVLIFIVIAAVCLMIMALKEGSRFKFPMDPLLCSISLALLAVSTYEVYRPRRPFPHYLTLLIFPLGLAGVSAFSAMLRCFRRKRILAAFLFVVMTTAIPTILRSGQLSQESEIPLVDLPHHPEFGRSYELVHSSARPGEFIAVWGWTGEYYVVTKTISSARDVVTPYSAKSHPQQAYYRERYMRDLKERPPKVFVDAVGPGQLLKNRESFAHENFPALRDYIDSGFDLVGDFDGARVYVRKE